MIRLHFSPSGRLRGYSTGPVPVLMMLAGYAIAALWPWLLLHGWLEWLVGVVWTAIVAVWAIASVAVWWERVR